MKKNKIATADEAISVIKDGDVMAAAGFVGNGTPEEHRNIVSGCYPSQHQRRDALKFGR
jgi:acyl CoA:acetate/3-ketoacid CoA transferase alpha subunit